MLLVIICNFIKRFMYSLKWTWLSANFEVAFRLIHLYMYYYVMITQSTVAVMNF